MDSLENARLSLNFESSNFQHPCLDSTGPTGIISFAVAAVTYYNYSFVVGRMKNSVKIKIFAARNDMQFLMLIVFFYLHELTMEILFFVCNTSFLELSIL